MAARRLARTLPFVRALPLSSPLAFTGTSSSVAPPGLHSSAPPVPLPRFFSGIRGFRRFLRRRRPAAVEHSMPLKEREIELCARIDVEGADGHEVLNIAELLKLNAPSAMKSILGVLSYFEDESTVTSIKDIVKYEKVELSVMLCNDEFIRNLNREWQGEDRAIDLLSMSKYYPNVETPALILGQIVISVDTAARQAEEKGHRLLDEVRVLMIAGMLHLLDFNGQINSTEREELQLFILKDLGWNRNELMS